MDLNSIFAVGGGRWVKLSEIGDEITGKIVRADAQQEKDFHTKQGKWLVRRPLTEEDFIVAKAQKFNLKGEVGDWTWRTQIDEDIPKLKLEHGEAEEFQAFELPEVVLHLRTAEGEAVKLTLNGNMLKEAKRYVAEAAGPDIVPEVGGLFHMKVTAKDGKRRIFDGKYMSPNV